MLRFALALLLAAIPLAAQLSDAAKKLHADALVFDGHVHLINRQFYEGGSMGDRHDNGQVDLPRMKEGGVDAFFMSMFTSEGYYVSRFETKQTLRLIDQAYRQLALNKDKVELALNGADIDRITASGKMAAVMDLEGSFDLDGDLAVLRMLYKLGLRSAQLPAHNWTNNYADSCCAEPKWSGLTEHGKDVIREMNRLGMVINISHSSDETTAQAIATSEDPLVATHHGLRSVNDIPRLMTDENLRALAAKGGVIGFHIGNSFHNPKYHAWRTKRSGRAFWDTSGVFDRYRDKTIEEVDKMAGKGYSAGPRAPDDVRFAVGDWIAVVEKAIDLVGEDHVALGSDFDGGPTPPKPMETISDLPWLTQAMLDRGWSETRIKKFLGGNLLRVFRQVTR
ncbi:MAG: membrane dipeptidase [Acidobacteria bacterium]|nr:membrane dipeptidase [Acidobacteriota bacterium]